MIKNYLWMSPFFFFLLGFLSFSFFLPQKTIKAPAIIGLSVGHAALMLAENNLNLRIIAQKNEYCAKQEIVLSQNPQAGSAIKENQALYCVISKAVPGLRMPSFIGKSQHEVETWCKQQGLKPRWYFFKTDHPQKSCFAQAPEAGRAITDPDEIIFYISKENTIASTAQTCLE